MNKLIGIAVMGTATTALIFIAPVEGGGGGKGGGGGGGGGGGRAGFSGGGAPRGGGGAPAAVHAPSYGGVRPAVGGGGMAPARPNTGGATVGARPAVAGGGMATTRPNMGGANVAAARPVAAAGNPGLSRPNPVAGNVGGGNAAALRPVANASTPHPAAGAAAMNRPTGGNVSALGNSNVNHALLNNHNQVNNTANRFDPTRVNAINNNKSGNKTNVAIRSGNQINNVNSTTRNVNMTRNVTVNNVTNQHFNNWGGTNWNGYNGGWAGRGGNWGYDRGWVHGYWSGHNSGWGNGAYGPGYGAYGSGYGSGYGSNAAWFGLGALTGFGLSSWAWGPSLYSWGYSSYANPYYSQQPIIVQNQPILVQAQSAYDYSQPINVNAQPPEPVVADTANTTFDNARAAFAQGDYTSALSLADRAVTGLPSDTTLHEFRALCLFALRRYQESAAVLYSVLSIGPGWDWTTMVGLYPSVDVYTNQLRTLEGYVKVNPDSAPALFVLGYQYLTEGFTVNAKQEFAQVARLQPNDKLAAQLAGSLATQPPDTGGGVPANIPPVGPPAQAETLPPVQPMPAGAQLAGSWVAKPNANVTISLEITAESAFNWTVKGPTTPTTIKGEASIGDDGLLTLSSSDQPPLVGRLSWSDATHVTFVVPGGPPNDPGLAFAKL